MQILKIIDLELEIDRSINANFIVTMDYDCEICLCQLTISNTPHVEFHITHGLYDEMIKYLSEGSSVAITVMHGDECKESIEKL